MILIFSLFVRCLNRHGSAFKDEVLKYLYLDWALHKI